MENERNTAKETEDRVSWLPDSLVLTVSRDSMHRLRPFAQGILLATRSAPWLGELPTVQV